MGNFIDHLDRFERNLEFLQLTSTNITQFYDWKVTIVFYSGVHLVNAHIAKSANLHYRTHSKVIDALSPFEKVDTNCSIPEDEYAEFCRLRNLSRRARYMVHDNVKVFNTNAHPTKFKHYKDSMKSLDKLISYFTKRYQFDSPNLSIVCPSLNNEDFDNFQIVHPASL